MSHSIIDRIQILWDLGAEKQPKNDIEYIDTPFSEKARELEGELAKRIDERITQYQDGLITCGEFCMWVIDAAMKE